MASNFTTYNDNITGYVAGSPSSHLHIENSETNCSNSNSESHITGKKETRSSNSSVKKYRNAITSAASLGAVDTTGGVESETRNDVNGYFVRDRQRNSGGFLLSNVILQSSFGSRYPSHGSERNPSAFKKSYPAGGTIMATQDTMSNDLRNRSELSATVIPENKTTSFDVNPTQIVNLALNLSETRRVASRRAMLLPLKLNSMNESMFDETTRSSLQLNQRLNRINSPKISGIDLTSPASLQPNPGTSIQYCGYDSYLNQAYKYQFSPSTLARSQKAKTNIELMAQYRRLLQLVPPLNPLDYKPERAKNSASLLSEFLDKQPPYSTPDSSKPLIQLGRSYNLLQYIRNRKLRARISKTINGEEQGFGDIKKVSRWVDDVAKIASTIKIGSSGNILLPKFPQEIYDDSLDTPDRIGCASNQDTSVKAKRPRIDWIINPADLIADLYWLEQDDNKKLIEDRNGDPIFSTEIHSIRPKTCEARIEESHLWKLSSPHKKGPRLDLRIDTDIPGFKTLNSESERLSHKASSTSRQCTNDAYDITPIQHSSDNSSRSYFYSRTRSRSSSLSLGSDVDRGRKRHRSQTKDSYDHAKILHGKKLAEATTKKVSSERVFEIESKRKLNSRKSTLVPDLEKGIAKNNSDRGNEQTCNLYDVMPQHLEDYFEYISDSTTPNSTQSKKKQYKGNAKAGLKWEIDNTQHHNQRLVTEKEMNEKNRRSLSKPRIKINPSVKDTRENLMSPDSGQPKWTTECENSRKISAGTRKIKVEGERSSGIREFLKSARNPVSRVSDFLWRKDSLSGSPGVISIEDSDIDDLLVHRTNFEGLQTLQVTENEPSQENSAGLFPGKEDIKFQSEEFSQLIPLNPNIAHPVETFKRSWNVNSQQSPGHQTKQGLTHLDFNNIYLLKSPQEKRVLRNNSVASESSSNHMLNSEGILGDNVHLNSIFDFTRQSPKSSTVARLSGLDIIDQDQGHKWWYNNRRFCPNQHLVTTKEIARVRTLLLSSGIKAREIRRRSGISKNFTSNEVLPYLDGTRSALSSMARVPKIQLHKRAVEILSEDIIRSSNLWNSSSEKYIRSTINSLIERITALQVHLVERLTPMTRSAADEADAVSRDLVTDYRLAVTHVADQITQIIQRRKARFRWLGRGGWVILEWILIGIMWWVWFVVVIVRIVLGMGKMIVRGVRWLFWL